MASTAEPCACAGTYRGERGRLPEGLEDLLLGNLVPNPFVQLGQQLPMQARVFVVAASIRAFGAPDRRVRVDEPEAALGMRCLRRLEGIRYQTAESEDWHEFRLPDEAVLGHASLPAL